MQAMMRVLQTMMSLLQNRGELALLEWQQERQRLLNALVLAALAACLGVAGVVFGAVLVLLLVPDAQRAWVALAAMLLLMLAGFWCWRRMQQLLSMPSFAALRHELQQDRAMWERAWRDAQTPSQPEGTPHDES